MHKPKRIPNHIQKTIKLTYTVLHCPELVVVDDHGLFELIKHSQLRLTLTPVSSRGPKAGRKNKPTKGVQERRKEVRSPTCQMDDVILIEGNWVSSQGLPPMCLCVLYIPVQWNLSIRRPAWGGERLCTLYIRRIGGNERSCGPVVTKM